MCISSDVKIHNLQMTMWIFKKLIVTTKKKLDSLIGYQKLTFSHLQLRCSLKVNLHIEQLRVQSFQLEHSLFLL